MSFFHNDLPGRDEVFHPLELRICRDYSEGNYTPDWRYRQMLEYVSACKGTHQYPSIVLERLSNETDQYIKQLLEFRQTGTCEQGAAYEWAWSVFSQNMRTGFGSLIKALVLARCTPETIATLVGTEPENIEVFIAVFWDVARYFGVMAAEIDFLGYYRDRTAEDIEADREDLLFGPARNWGTAGLALLLTPHIGVSEAERGIVSAIQDEIINMEERHHERCKTAGVVLAVPDLTRWAWKLEFLLTSPYCGENRVEAFEEAVLAIGRGAPLDEYL